MTAVATHPGSAPAPEPAIAPPPGNPRFPLFDGLRAVAVMSVLVGHAAGVTAFNADNRLGVLTARLDVGVTVFFLLSGFLLYRPFVSARERGTPAVRWRAFYRRRLLRIVPAYWVALTVLSLWPGLPGFSDHTWRYYTFTQIYWLDSATQGIGPAWSLCIEMSFYLVLPLLAWGIARLARGREGQLRTDFAVLGVLAVASAVLRSGLKAQGGLHVASTTLLVYFDWFAIGMALAALSVAWQHCEQDAPPVRAITRRPWISWAIALAVYVVVATQFDLPRGFYAIYTDVGYQARHLGYALVALFLMLPAVFGVAGGGWPRRLLGHPFAMWLGLISYAVFLYQVPIAVYLRTHQWWDPLPSVAFPMQTLATALLTIGFAVLSYHVVERPILRFKERRAR